ncbi:MAG: hypothetical protein HYZ53_18525 [Planctomycetes bacterium]|nr:hypothetical protein [Planctomycetota bacterium]
MSKTLFFNCNACSGLVEVPRDLDKFFCVYCGSQYKLEWQGQTPLPKRESGPLLKTTGGRLDDRPEKALQRAEQECKEMEDQYRDALEDIRLDLEEEGTLFDQISSLEGAGVEELTRPADLIALGLTLFCFAGGSLALYDAYPFELDKVFHSPLTRYPFIMTILGSLLLIGTVWSLHQRRELRAKLRLDLARHRERERTRHEMRKAMVDRRFQARIEQRRAEIERLKSTVAGGAGGQT